MSFTITTKPDELTEGLFGQIFLYIFEKLPYLEQNQIHPSWNIRSLKYGVAPSYTVIPGVLDVAYDVARPKSMPERSLANIRLEQSANLGSDWKYTHQLWGKYFKIPERVLARANGYGNLTGALGLHYRGTDKNLDLIHTNPVSQKDFFIIVDDFLVAHPEINKIFIATDQHDFLESAKAKYCCYTIIETGKVDFWKEVSDTANLLKGDHALLDCVLLSRCQYLIKCQSALSGFAKVLNPNLIAFRVAASKPFFYGIPYFPDAYVQRYSSDNRRCRKLLHRLFKGDWQDNANTLSIFGNSFMFMPREEAARLMIPIQKPEQQNWHERYMINSIIRRLKKLVSNKA